MHRTVWSVGLVKICIISFGQDDVVTGGVYAALSRYRRVRKFSKYQMPGIIRGGERNFGKTIDRLWVSCEIRQSQVANDYGDLVADLQEP